MRRRIIQHGPGWQQSLDLFAMPAIRGVIRGQLGVDVTRVMATVHVTSAKGAVEMTAPWDVCASRVLSELLAGYIDLGRMLEHPALIALAGLGGLGMSLYGATAANSAPTPARAAERHDSTENGIRVMSAPPPVENAA